MHGPAVVSWLLVALCGATGAYCLTRLRGGTAGQRRGSGIEAAMGLGMAAMALPGTSAAPMPLLLAVVFGGTALYALHALYAARASGVPRAHCLHHALEALAMLYMAVVMHTAAGGGHAAHTTAPGGIPAVTGALLLYFAGYALRTGTRLVPVAASGAVAGGAVPGGHRAPAAVGGPVRLPGTADACRLSLALGSFAMLLTL